MTRAEQQTTIPFCLAAASQSLALPGGCTLYVRDPIVPIVATTNALGVAAVKVPIPYDPGFLGGTVWAQAVCVDPAGPFAGLVFSGGRTLVLGD
jgi:hypothetical protein